MTFDEHYREICKDTKWGLFQLSWSMRTRKEKVRLLKLKGEIRRAQFELGMYMDEREYPSQPSRMKERIKLFREIFENPSLALLHVRSEDLLTRSFCHFIIHDEHNEDLKDFIDEQGKNLGV